MGERAVWIGTLALGFERNFTVLALCRMSHSFASTLSHSSPLNPEDMGGFLPLPKLQKEGTQFSSSHLSRHYFFF